MIRKAVEEFYAYRTEEKLITLLNLLRENTVWVPCNAVFSEADQKRMEEMLAEGIAIGDDFTTQDPVRMQPDLLQNGQELFFPVFSSEEEMGSYGEGFSKVEMTLAEAVRLAEHNERPLAGIVLNAFTQPFELPAELYDYFRG